MCALCKRWDAASTMYYNVRNSFYRHYSCSSVNGKNASKIKKLINADNLPKRYFHPVIGKCKYCKGFDNKNNFNQRSKCDHPECKRVNFKNSKTMKPYKTDTCAFTKLPFGSKSEMKPVGDHDHDTLLYRGHIWSAANRLEGAAKFIMNEAGWTVDELCDALKSYLAKPGIDIGLEPYQQLGFSTPEEAEQHYGNQI